MIETTEVGQDVETQTCLVTIACDGHGDKVIKISPALHAAERVWLNTAPGKERWDEIRRVMGKFLPRGVDVPRPESYHNDSHKLNIITLHEKDIPLAELEDHVFQPGVVSGGVDVWLKPGERVRNKMQPVPPPVLAGQTGPDARVSTLEMAVSTIADTLRTVTEGINKINSRLDDTQKPHQFTQTPAIVTGTKRRGRPPKVKK